MRLLHAVCGPLVKPQQLAYVAKHGKAAICRGNKDLEKALT